MTASPSSEQQSPTVKPTAERRSVVVRFCGDVSGGAKVGHGSGGMVRLRAE